MKLLTQAKAEDKILGIAYGFNLSNESVYKMMYVGTWYRVKESFIPYIGFNLGNFQWGLSYDVISSDLKMASPKTGSFELSLNILEFKPSNNYTSYPVKRVF